MDCDNPQHIKAGISPYNHLVGLLQLKSLISVIYAIVSSKKYKRHILTYLDMLKWKIRKSPWVFLNLSHGLMIWMTLHWLCISISYSIKENILTFIFHIILYIPLSHYFECLTPHKTTISFMVNSPIRSPFWMVNSQVSRPGSQRQRHRRWWLSAAFCQTSRALLVLPFGFCWWLFMLISWWFNGILWWFDDDFILINGGFHGILWWFNAGLMGFILIPRDIFGINGGFHGVSQASNVPRWRQGAAARPKPSHCAAARSAARWRSPRCLRWKPRCWERFINGPLLYRYMAHRYHIMIKFIYIMIIFNDLQTRYMAHSIFNNCKVHLYHDYIP